MNGARVTRSARQQAHRAARVQPERGHERSDTEAAQPGGSDKIARHVGDRHCRQAAPSKCRASRVRRPNLRHKLAAPRGPRGLPTAIRHRGVAVRQPIERGPHFNRCLDASHGPKTRYHLCKFSFTDIRHEALLQADMGSVITARPESRCDPANSRVTWLKFFRTPLNPMARNRQLASRYAFTCGNQAIGDVAIWIGSPRRTNRSR
jgi:hypothetical protein